MSEYSIEAQRIANKVKGSLAIEDLNITDDTYDNICKCIDGEKTFDALKEEVIKNYKVIGEY